MTLSATIERRKHAPRRQGGPCAADLLAWYDRHGRTLPWRALPGERPDPYRVWLSEIMLQQTTVKAVAPYFASFTARWPTVQALASAPLDDVLRLWAGLGYYARARNLHACAQAVVQRHDGQFPTNEGELVRLPGIGPYSACAIAAIAFDRPVAAVDGNVERVVARLFAVERELASAKADIRRIAQGLVPSTRAGDFAQALMDLGAILCRPKKPTCEPCPWRRSCAASRRGAENFANLPAKPRGRLRRGAAFVVWRRDGMILLRTRALAGLLGGMTEVPTTEWLADFDIRTALEQAPRLCRRQIRWQRLPGTVSHAFTHFPLSLIVYAAELPADAIAPAGSRWVPMAGLASEALPTVMRKVLTHALTSGRQGLVGAPAQSTGLAGMTGPRDDLKGD
jgi:A/G-specific adenine glycosylase